MIEVIRKLKQKFVSDRRGFEENVEQPGDEQKSPECAEIERVRMENQSLREQLQSIGEELAVERRRNLALQSLLDGGLSPQDGGANERPSVLFNALPKSASTFCFETIRRAGAYHESSISVEIFPYDLLAWKRYYAFAKGGHIAHHHLDASPVNLWLLRQRPVRIVLHLRDPRQALISYRHHLTRHKVQEIPPCTVTSPPHRWFDLPESEQLDWMIDNHLPLFVAWIEDWTAAIDRREVDVLVTTFEDMVRNSTEYFETVARHCGLDPSLPIALPDPRDDSMFQFRSGRVDEWREVYTAAQMESVRRLVPEHMVERFGWQRS